MEKALVTLGDGKALGSSFLADDLVVREITTLYGEIALSLKITLDKAIRIGELLTIKKDSLGHGCFTEWVRRSLPFTDRTARNYMRCFGNREQIKTETVSVLTDAYKLLANKSYHPECIRPLDSYYAAKGSLMLLAGCDLDNSAYHDLFVRANTLTDICLGELRDYFDRSESLEARIAITEMVWLERISGDLQFHWAVETIRCEARAGKAIKDFEKQAQDLEWVKKIGGDALVKFLAAHPDEAIDLLEKKIAELEAEQTNVPQPVGVGAESE